MKNSKLIDTRSDQSTVSQGTIGSGLPNVVIGDDGQPVAAFSDRETAQAWFRQQTGHDNYAGKELAGQEG
jgi:hypothetical protein